MPNKVRTIFEPIESDITEIILRFGTRTEKVRGADGEVIEEIEVATVDMDIFANARCAEGIIERIRTTVKHDDLLVDGMRVARALLPVALPGLRDDNGF